MVVGEGLLSAARFALRVVACGNALSLALKSNLGRSFSSFPAWAEYLIADSFENSGAFESDGGGGRITQRCALRPSGRCLRQRSLAGAQVEPWSKLLILPRLGWWWGKDYSALRASPFGSLPAATLSRWRSSRTLVEASHPSPLGQNI